MSGNHRELSMAICEALGLAGVRDLRLHFTVDGITARAEMLVIERDKITEIVRRFKISAEPLELEQAPGDAPTPEQQQQLNGLITRMRRIAEPVGSMHSYWDTISEAEAILRGRPVTLKMTVPEFIAWCDQELQRDEVTSSARRHRQ